MEFYRIHAEILPQIHFIDKTVVTPPYVHKRRKAGEYVVYFVQNGEMYLREESQPITLVPACTVR